MRKKDEKYADDKMSYELPRGKKMACKSMQITRWRMQGQVKRYGGKVMEGLVKLGYQGVLTRLGWVFDFANNRQFQLLKKHFRIREPLVLSMQEKKNQNQRTVNSVFFI